MYGFFPFVAAIMGCPDPPTEIAAQEERGENQGTEDGAVRPGGEPDRMDLSPGGTVLLDMEQVKVQQTQEELIAQGIETVTISGELFGDCTGGTLRIDIIELDVEQTPTGPMLGPVTALNPEGAGPFAVRIPKGKNVQVAAICDIDNDQKIVQDTDKLAPGVALGTVSEDKADITLAFPGERQALVPSEVNSASGGAAPPGDANASNPSAELGQEDTPDAATEGLEEPVEEPVEEPTEPAEEAPPAAPPEEAEATTEE